MAPLDAAHAPPSPPPGHHLQRPPFRFYLFDDQQRALFPIPPYRVGDAMRDTESAHILPIELDGRVVAYFSPQGQVNYSDLDLGYLAAMRDALAYGLAAATLLALVLGVVFGTRLSAALRRLTEAIVAVGSGALKQHVPATSRDEVGVLARAFNRMSDEIAKSHQALRVSNEQIRLQAEQLQELSVRDALTQLHNRRYFDEQARHQFEQAVRYQRPFAVMIGDIDFFKRINDRHSHAMGDAVLKQVAEILRSKVRAADIVARYGGEEFVIAFPETDLQQAAAACEALRQQIEAYPWHELHPELKVTMSMGLDANTHAGSMEAMLSAADGLLYLAKSSGRNRVCAARNSAEV
jgi:diguanylate cyclase (GGDEF)-like protein